MTRPLKKELYYAKEILRRRFPPMYYVRYLVNRYFGFQVLKRAEPFHCEGRDDFEVHILSPKSDLLMAYWAIRSFLRHSGLCPRVYVHSDGSIDELSARLLESKFSNVKVVLKADADRIINEDMSIPQVVKDMRNGSNPLIFMFLDHYLLSESENVLVLDNDIIFYSRPDEIIRFMEGNEPDSMVSRANYECPLDVTDDYAARHRLYENGGGWMNSGIILFRKSKFPMGRIVEYFENTSKPEGHFIEQAGWAALICQTNFAFLPEKTYHIKGGVGPETIAKHFTSPRRYEMFAYGMARAELKK